MRKNVFGRQLKRDTNERKALFKGLMSSLVLHERMKTTEEKARVIRGQVEKLVTRAKNKGEASRSILSASLLPNALDKMIKNVAPRFQNRPGGYTRIVKLDRRFGDNARMVLMEWVELSKIKNVETEPEEKVTKEPKIRFRTRRTATTRAKTKTKKVRKEVKK